MEPCASKRRAPLALSLSLLFHAALFAAMCRLALSPDRPAGDESVVVPNITFGLMVAEPRVEPPPEPAVAPPVPAPPEPAPPISVIEPAPTPPVEPVTMAAVTAPALSPTPPQPARTAVTSAQPARGDRGGNVSFVPAVCTYRASPDYPPVARRERRQGTVLVMVQIDARGRVENARVVAGSGDGRLDAAALAAARRCRFQPALRNGAATASEVRVPYTFRLDR